jgi:hypothetical protein
MNRPDLQWTVGEAFPAQPTADVIDGEVHRVVVRDCCQRLPRLASQTLAKRRFVLVARVS